MIVVKDNFLSKITFNEQYPFSFFAEADRYYRQDLADRKNSQYEKCFPYIRYSWDSFRSAMVDHLKDAKSFIDVGCGAGDKVYLAKKINPKLWACGIELCKPLTVWADSLGIENVWHGDAFKLDYSNWDVIYAYWPIPDNAQMTMLMYHIITTMRKDATLVIVGWRGPERSPNPMSRMDWGWIYFKP